MHDPGHFAMYMEQGAALHASGHPEQALVAFEAALALQPDNAIRIASAATKNNGILRRCKSTLTFRSAPSPCIQVTAYGSKVMSSVSPPTRKMTP